MSKRKAYPIEILLKMKQLKPDIKFEGADKRKWEDFIEKEAESSLFNELDNMKSEPEKPVEKSKKNKRSKVKQVFESTNTESFDIRVEDEKIEANNNQSETEIQRHQEDEMVPELEA